MSIKNLFYLFFLVITMHIHGQSIPGGYIDTVRWKYNNNLKVLTVERKDFKTRPFTFKVKIKNDSLLLDRKEMDSLLLVINRFSAGQPVSDILLLDKLQDSTRQGSFIFPEGDDSDPGSSGDPQVEELKRVLAEKEKLIQYLFFGVGGLLLVTLSLLVWGMITAKSKRKIQRKQQQDMTIELIALMDKYFEKVMLYPDSNDISPDELLAQLAKKQKDLKEKLESLEKSLIDAERQLSDKDLKLKEDEQKIENHNEELKKLKEEFQVVQASEKERTNSLCAKMIDRKDLFLKSIRGLDEDVAKKELIRFSFAYAEMAVAVLDEIRGKNSEIGKMNIRLLNGGKENFAKTFDQHTSENAIDREYILIAKLLSDYGIESIEDVFFNGDKFQQKK